MTELVITCDRCLKRMDRVHAMLALKRREDRDFADRDLCESCSAGLQAWLLTGPLPPAEAAPANSSSGPLTAPCSL